MLAEARNPDAKEEEKGDDGDAKGRSGEVGALRDITTGFERPFSLTLGKIPALIYFS